MKCFPWIKPRSALIHLKFDTTIPHPQSFPAFLAISVKVPPDQLNPNQHNPYHVLYWFPYFFLPHMQPHSAILDILNHMPSQDKQIYYQVHIINLYTNQNTLLFKHAAYRKADSSRAASLSQLDNTVNNNSIFYKKCAEFSKKWQVLFHCHNPT